MIKSVERQAFDVIGRELQVGDYVSFYDRGWGTVYVGRVLRFTKKMVRVGYRTKSRWNSGEDVDRTVYENECTWLEPAQVMLWLMK